MTKGTEPLGMKVWVSPQTVKNRISKQNRNLRPTEMLAEGEENIGWIVEEGSNKYHIRPFD